MTKSLDYFLFPEKLFFDSFSPSFDAFFQREKEYPPYDIYYEDDGSCVLEVALAGYPKENVSVKTEMNNLIISATKVEEKEKKGFSRMAKRAFTKSFKDPYGKFDLSKIKAVLKDGVLKVVVPAKEDATPKSVEIEVA